MLDTPLVLRQIGKSAGCGEGGSAQQFQSICPRSLYTFSAVGTLIVDLLKFTVQNVQKYCIIPGAEQRSWPIPNPNARRSRHSKCRRPGGVRRRGADVSRAEKPYSLVASPCTTRARHSICLALAHLALLSDCRRYIYILSCSCLVCCGCLLRLSSFSLHLQQLFCH